MRFPLLLTLVFASMLFLSGCSQLSGEFEVNSEIRLGLKWLHQAQFSGFYVAKSQGLYQEAGLPSVEIIPGGPGISSIQDLVDGKTDFAVAGADDVLVARGKGQDVVAVAVIYQKSPVVYYSLAESEIYSLEDLVGKRVGVRQGTGTYYTYLTLLRSQGLDPNQVTEVPALNPGSDLLLEGEVDVLPGFSINEPRVLERQGYVVNEIDPGDYGQAFYADVIVTTEDMIEHNYETVDAFVDASLSGWEVALQDQSYAVEQTLALNQSLEKDHQEDMLDTSYLLIKPSPAFLVGSMNFGGWQRYYAALNQNQLIETPFEVRQAYTTDFIEN